MNFRTLLTALLLAAGLSTVPTATASAATPAAVSLTDVVAAAMPIMTAKAARANCTGPHYASDYRYVTERIRDGRPDPTWRTMHELRFRNCARAGTRRWADPVS